MKIIRFFGQSDDLLVCVEPDRTRELDCWRAAAVYRVTSSEGSVLVFGRYDVAGNGCWTLGISPSDDGVPIPDWPIRIRAASKCCLPPCYGFIGYTALLEIEAPDDAVVSALLPAREEE